MPGWTRADAAGLSIFPGLVRYYEATSGVIRNGLRFTVSSTRKGYVPSAAHCNVSSNTSADVPPMGIRVRVRLKASYVIPVSFSIGSKAILQSMKIYGMLVADSGFNWYVSGPSTRTGTMTSWCQSWTA